MMQTTNYPDVSTSYPQIPVTIQNQTYTAAQINNNSSTSGFNPKAPYVPYVPTFTTYQPFDLASGQWANGVNIPQTCNINGFQKPIAN